MRGQLNRKADCVMNARRDTDHVIRTFHNFSQFQYFECTKCAGAWYGVPLFLFLELFLLTVLYLVILIFQVNITSGSTTCFIFYSRLVVIALDHVFDGDIIYAASEHSVTKWIFNILVTFCDVWNLGFFRNVLPLFCIIGLKPIHILFYA